MLKNTITWCYKNNSQSHKYIPIENRHKCYKYLTHWTMVKWQVFQPHKQDCYKCISHVHWEC